MFVDASALTAACRSVSFAARAWRSAACESAAVGVSYLFLLGAWTGGEFFYARKAVKG